MPAKRFSGADPAPVQSNHHAGVAEPAPLDSAFPRLLTYSVPTNKLVSDAYVAAFAIAGTLRLATLDSGFEQFRGLDLELLAT
jgi:predicted nucleic acid-binding protein